MKNARNLLLGASLLAAQAVSASDDLGTYAVMLNSASVESAGSTGIELTVTAESCAVQPLFIESERVGNYYEVVVKNSMTAVDCFGPTSLKSYSFTIEVGQDFGPVKIKNPLTPFRGI